MNLFADSSINVTFPQSFLIFVIGMAVIFIALAILIFTVNGCSLFFKIFGKKDKKDKKTVHTVDVETIVTNDEEIVAAIMAAITAIYASESDDGEAPPFIVKSIIRK